MANRMAVTPSAAISSITVKPWRIETSTLDGRAKPHHFAASLSILPRTARMRIRPLLFTLATIAVTGCTNPRAEANVAQALQDAASEISGLKNDLSNLQVDMDSLRAMVM